MDTVTITSDGKLTIKTAEGRKVERTAALLQGMFQHDLIPPINGTALPDGTKFLEYRDPLLIVVHQQPPHVRRLRWIAPDSPRDFGPNVKYRHVRLSFPYTVTLATFVRQPSGTLANLAKNELYFATGPVKTKEAKLYYPALLNISVMNYNGRPSTWICTQYLRAMPNDHWTTILEKLLEHTWNGAFNLSSEHHEGASWYTDYKGTEGIHPVEDWEARTEEDDAYGLKVDWKPAGTVGGIVEAIYEDQQHIILKKDSEELVNRIIKFAQI
jgi:hypothetical protein